MNHTIIKHTEINSVVELGQLVYTCLDVT